MDNRDNFAGGFIAGAIFGGVVGGLLGSFLTSKLAQEASPGDDPLIQGRPTGDKIPRSQRRRQPFQASTELSIEEARQGLEVKIAQLNEAIDDVRHQLGNVNGTAQED
jgi:hypothetical protein